MTSNQCQSSINSLPSALPAPWDSLRGHDTRTKQYITLFEGASTSGENRVAATWRLMSVTLGQEHTVRAGQALCSVSFSDAVFVKCQTCSSIIILVPASRLYTHTTVVEWWVDVGQARGNQSHRVGEWPAPSQALCCYQKNHTKLKLMLIQACFWRCGCFFEILTTTTAQKKHYCISINLNYTQFLVTTWPNSPILWLWAARRLI